MSPSVLPAKSMARRSFATFWNSRSDGEYWLGVLGVAELAATVRIVAGLDYASGLENGIEAVLGICGEGSTLLLTPRLGDTLRRSDDSSAASSLGEESGENAGEAKVGELKAKRRCPDALMSRDASERAEQGERGEEGDNGGGRAQQPAHDRGEHSQGACRERLQELQRDNVGGVVVPAAATKLVTPDLARGIAERPRHTPP